MFTIYLAIGGSEESMKKRCEKLNEKKEEKRLKDEWNCMVILSGFLSEILFMKEFFPGEYAHYAYSYDTLSNINNCLDYLESADEVWIATSPLHWERIKIILKKLPSVEKKIKWIKTEEQEAKYAKFGLKIYKLLGPKFLQKVAMITRLMKYFLEYRILLNEKKWYTELGYKNIEDH